MYWPLHICHASNRDKVSKSRTPFHQFSIGRHYGGLMDLDLMDEADPVRTSIVCGCSIL